MTMYAIEKSVPLQPRKGGNGAPAKYPFSSMQVGDSFFVPCGAYGEKERRRLAGAAVAFAKNHHGYRFSVRSVDGGYRVWRIPTSPALVAAE